MADVDQKTSIIWSQPNPKWNNHFNSSFFVCAVVVVALRLPKWPAFSRTLRSALTWIDFNRVLVLFTYYRTQSTATLSQCIRDASKAARYVLFA